MYASNRIAWLTLQVEILKLPQARFRAGKHSYLEDRAMGAGCGIVFSSSSKSWRWIRT